MPDRATASPFSPRVERLIRQAPALLRCDGQDLRRLTHAAIIWLETNHRAINALNVFPVPDGDTGTNMLLTMQAAYREIAHVRHKHVGRVAHAIAHGALMGARGNSGVILSQIWRGFARAVDGVEAFDADGLVRAMQSARDTAYRGVVKPVEGTILTVIKDVAAGVAAARRETDDLRYLLAQMVQTAQESVMRTPDLLAKLKEAGVVDAGGKGLAVIFDGMLRYLQGLPLTAAAGDETEAVVPLRLEQIGAAPEAIAPGQEWEVVVDFRPAAPLDLSDFYRQLESVGTSIQFGEGDGLCRLHIHLLRARRYEPLELVERLGTVLNVRMENLLAQMAETTTAMPGGVVALPENGTPGQIAVVAVAPGPGIARIFSSLGAVVIGGGQTMNPPTESFIDVINSLPTDRVLILPNNKNIIPTARQAAELLQGSKQVAVVPSRSVPQGLAAQLQFLNKPPADLAEAQAAMEAALGEVETGEITTATRSVEIDGIAVAAGQIIGLHNGVLRAAGKDVESTVLRLLECMDVAGRQHLTFYYGADVTAEQAARLAEAVCAAYPNQEVEVHNGGQPHYHYILSAE